MSYEHHIFISYKRGKLFTPWVRKWVIPRLQHYLDEEIGSSDIFVDEQIQTGARWADVLRHKVCRSKLMVSLVSAAYFQSEWCKREMALILEREERHHLIGNGANYGLLIPVRLGDGDCFPEPVSRLQYFDLAQHTNVDMAPGSVRNEEFSQKMCELALIVAETLKRSPPWCDTWQSLDGASLIPRLEPLPLPAPVPPRIII